MCGLSSTDDLNSGSRGHNHLRVNIPPSAKDYVESLHQNNRVTLLYGKNNVVVQPVSHQSAMTGLTVNFNRLIVSA